MYDVVVVGAGPAGTTAAKHIAEKGLDTLIIEKSKLPREKPCAGLVSQHALDNLDFKIPEYLIKRRCYGTRVIYKNHVLESKLAVPIGIQVSRSEFDYYLAQQATKSGAKIIQNTPVKSVHTKNDHVAIYTKDELFNSRIVIGADGVNSVCAKKASSDSKPRKNAFSLVSNLPAPIEHINNKYIDITEVDFGRAKNGYFWVFPKDNYLSVGMGIFGNPSEFEPLTSYYDYIKDQSFEYAKPHGHSIPIGGYKRNIQSNRILLVGDAAGFVDAFLGEGIPYAIMSGKIAANIVINAFEDNDFSNSKLSSYSIECEKVFGDNLKYSLIFSRLFYRFPGIFAKMLTNREEMLYNALLVVKGESSYKRFLRWLIPRFPYYTALLLKKSLI
ncbi:MAG: geranylgeranyl reductase family protein [Methanohalobium sp.]|uniref:geranylgeranyl reductase family protein n=1 Tax=Methanohalobium sp. TaxID=2837493 RepID=UPI00397AE142